MTASKRGIAWEHDPEWCITWDEYKELDYFCRQYARKKRDADALLTLRVSTPTPVQSADGSGEFTPRGGGSVSDPVSAAAEKRERLLRDVAVIDKAAQLAGDDLAPYLLRAVTTRDGVQKVIASGCPCSERTFYRMRRRFFYILWELKNRDSA